MALEVKKKLPYVEGDLPYQRTSVLCDARYWPSVSGFWWCKHGTDVGYEY